MKRDLWFKFPSVWHFAVLIGRHDTLYEGILFNQRPSYVSRARGIKIVFRLRMSAVYFLATTKCLRHLTGLCSSKTQRSILSGAGGLNPRAFARSAATLFLSFIYSLQPRHSLIFSYLRLYKTAPSPPQSPVRSKFYRHICDYGIV